MPRSADSFIIDWSGVNDEMSAEFEPADLGDKRREKRLTSLASCFGRTPGASIPAACADEAATKAAYRFCDNEDVDPTDIRAGHVEAHANRIGELDELLVVSDTTHLTFPSHPSKEGLGNIGKSSIDVEGVKLHSTIGINPKTEVMTGLLDQQVLIQDQAASQTHETNGRGPAEELASEQDKWLRGDRAALEALPAGVRPIFVHDRGADSFGYFRHMAEEAPRAGYVVRAQRGRSIRTPTGDRTRLFDWSEGLAELGRTTIEIEQSGDRPGREAELSIKSGTCELLAPATKPYSGMEEVNVVRVEEVGREENEADEDAIEWVLFTTEPVETFEETMTVIEYYRARWKIEDWHRVLKSGCGIEERQLQTWERMEVLLSIFSVVAWKVLELRELARGSHETPPGEFLSDIEQAILEAKYPELTDANGVAYAVAVAKAGGYLDRGSDPPPGWETMWKGLEKVRQQAEGFELLAEEFELGSD